MSARLKASGVEMSGAGAPSRTATPVTVRPRSRIEPAARRPSWSSAAMIAAGRISRSAVSPPAKRARKAPAVPKFRSSRWPLKRSNSLPIASTMACTAPALMTLMVGNCFSLGLCCHARASGHPVNTRLAAAYWVPACAGTTASDMRHRPCFLEEGPRRAAIRAVGDRADEIGGFKNPSAAARCSRARAAGGSSRRSACAAPRGCGGRAGRRSRPAP